VFYILDMRLLRGTPHQVENLVRQTAEVDGVGVIIYKEQEPGSDGAAVIDHYTRRVLQGFRFYGDRATGSKPERAGPVSSQAEAGNVCMVRAPWNLPVLDMFAAFPDEAVHDDPVDAVSGAFKYLLPQPKKRSGWRGKSGGWA
jgi:predicted phage terminase large subunit-like protein